MATTKTKATAAKKTTTKAKRARTAKKGATKAKATKTTKATKGAYGIERDHDLPWGETKVVVFKALRALGAKGATNARSAQEIAEKAGVTPRDVRHYCYHGRAGGLTDVAEIEGMRGYGFYLTAKGAKVNPDKEAKAQQG